MKYLASLEEFQAVVEESKNNKLVVIDFTATWCPPCRMIGPIFEAMAGDYPGVTFVKCDVDDANDVAAECGIRAMPTFQFYKGGQKVDELTGADPNKLKALVQKHA